MEDETLAAISENLTDSGEGSEFERLEREIEENPGSPSFPRLAEAYRRAGQVERAASIAESGLSEAPLRMGGRVALALAMIDKGEIAMASRELESIIENIPELPSETAELVAEATPVTEVAPVEHRLCAAPLASPSDALPQFDEELRLDRSGDELGQDEIDRAFEDARAEADQMFSANRLAESAVLDTEENDGADGELVAVDEACPDAAVGLENADVSGAVDGNYSVSDREVFATETMANVLERQGDIAGAEKIRAAIPDFSSELASDPPTDSARTRGKDRVINRLEDWLANLRRDVA